MVAISIFLFYMTLISQICFKIILIKKYKMQNKRNSEDAYAMLSDGEGMAYSPSDDDQNSYGSEYEYFDDEDFDDDEVYFNKEDKQCIMRKDLSKFKNIQFNVVGSYI